MNKILVRRVGPEIVELGRLAGSVTVTCVSDDVVRLSMKNLEGLDGSSVEFFIGGTYPFRPPVVAVNSRSYIQMLCCSTPRLASIIESLGGGGDKCLCCKSVLCENNWYPGLTLCQLLTEVRGTLETHRKSLHIYYCRIIANEHLTHDLPLESYL